MKNIIVYSTKYGSVEKAANILKKKLGSDTVLLNIKKEKAPSLAEFENVILGGSIYMGKIQKELTGYINANMTLLLKKRIGLFVCAAADDPQINKKQLEAAFPQELYQHAACKTVFGHEINFQKLNFFEKIAVRSQGIKENRSIYAEETIENFAGDLCKLQ